MKRVMYEDRYELKNNFYRVVGERNLTMLEALTKCGITVSQFEVIGSLGMTPVTRGKIEKFINENVEQPKDDTKKRLDEIDDTLDKVVSILSWLTKNNGLDMAENDEDNKPYEEEVVNETETTDELPKEPNKRTRVSFIAKYRGRVSVKEVPKEELFTTYKILYSVVGLSAVEIGNMFGYSHATISNYLKKEFEAND